MHKQNTEKEKALPVVSLQLWWSTERNKARLLGRGNTSFTGPNDIVRKKNKTRHAFGCR